MTVATLRHLLLPLAAFAIAGCSSESDRVPLKTLGEGTHFHGIAVDQNKSEYLYLATHHGFHRLDLDGMTQQISDVTDDFMGFIPHPSDPTQFIASGHLQRGGNLGVIVSTDGGETWSQRSVGADGPVDFHQLTISHADPDTLYGAYRGQLQISRDAGQEWHIQGPAPEGLIGLAASSQDADRLYAATQAGLLMSPDAGQRWRHAYPEPRPASVVTTTGAGDLYAFIGGVGLVHAREGSRDWQVLSDGWGDNYLLHLAVDPQDPERLYAIDSQGRVLASQDGGSSWRSLGD